MVLQDEESRISYQKIIDGITRTDPTDDVGNLLNNHIIQAVNKVFASRQSMPKSKRRGPAWFDRECRDKRSAVIRAGERAETAKDFADLIDKSKSYKACKQTKRRAHRHVVLNKIQEAFNLNNNGMWRILSEASNPSVDGDMPSPTAFYDMFYELSLPREAEYFNYDYEQCAIEFLKVYDQGEMLEIPSNKIMLDMINDNFSVDEIKATIDALKNGM